MNVIRINTTAYEEEDFAIVTDLTESQIVKIIRPIVLAERKGKGDYDNHTLHDALVSAYPNNTIDMFYLDNLDTIII